MLKYNEILGEKLLRKFWPYQINYRECIEFIKNETYKYERIVIDTCIFSPLAFFPYKKYTHLGDRSSNESCLLFHAFLVDNKKVNNNLEEIISNEMDFFKFLFSLLKKQLPVMTEGVNVELRKKVDFYRNKIWDIGKRKKWYKNLNSKNQKLVKDFLLWLSDEIEKFLYFIENENRLYKLVYLLETDLQIALVAYFLDALIMSHDKKIKKLFSRYCKKKNLNIDMEKIKQIGFVRKTGRFEYIKGY